MVVIETPHLRLRRDEIELPSGQRIGDYYVRESRGFAVVFAVTGDDRVVLVRQYKHGIAQRVIELPGGAIDELAGEFIYDPTSSTTRYHLFLARDVKPLLAPKLDETEEIAVRLATFAELRAYVRDGTIDVGAHVASIYYMLDRLGRL